VTPNLSIGRTTKELRSLVSAHVNIRRHVLTRAQFDSTWTVSEVACQF
jgi:hypothetical protein